jgi:FkbM family methyltransferase
MRPLRQLVAGAVSRVRRPFTAKARLARALSPHLPEIVCVDVGASYFPHWKWDLFIESPATQWIAVEPNAKNASYIGSWRRASRARLHPTGLSRSGGTHTLYVTNVDSGSSLLPPQISEGMKHRVRNLDYFFPVREVSIDTVTLADVLDDVSHATPVFVKLDTQGSELAILQGADTLIEARRIVGIEMEATLLAQPVMQGSGKFWQACQYLEEKAMELLTVVPIYGPSRLGSIRARGLTYLNECDAVFALRRDVAARLPPTHRAGLLAFYLSYELFEEALSLLDDDADLRALIATRGGDVARLRSTIVSVA